MARRLRDHDWFGVAIELLVVVLGILIAFQVDRWREARAERQLERSYLQRLISDVELDLPRIEKSIRLARERQALAELLMAAVQDPAAALAKPASFLFATDAAAWTNKPELAAHTFEDLRATGHLRLIRSEEVKKALFRYHDFDRTDRQWLALSLAGEQHWFELAAGVTDHAQARWISEELGYGGDGPEKRKALDAAQLEPAPVLAALERLRSRQAALDWMPQLHVAQTEQVAANEHRLELAKALLEQLRNALQEAGDA